MSHAGARTVLVVFVALAVALSLPAGAMAGSVHSTGDANATDTETTHTSELAAEELDTVTEEEIDAADEIYLDDDGNAVLRFEDDGVDDSQGEFGFDAAQGLVYTLIETENVSDDEEVDQIEAELLAELEPGQLQADGFVVMPAPEELEELDLEITGEQSAEAAQMEAQLLAEIQEQSAEEFAAELATTDDDGTAAQLAETSESVASDGSVTATTDSFESSGSLSASAEIPETEEAFYDVEFAGQDGDYTIDVTINHRIADWETEWWDTEANATQTLENQFAAIAEELGATADVQLEEHNFDDQTNELEIEYTVDIEGVEQAAIADALQEEDELTDEQAEAMADAILGVDVQTVSATFDSDADTNEVDASWDVDVRNLEPVAQTGFDIAEDEVEDEAQAEALQEARDRFDAASDTDYTHIATWDVDVEVTEESATIDATVTYDTENREAYVDALVDAGITDEPATVTYQIAAELEDDDRVNATGSVSIADETLLEDAVGGAIDAIREDDETDDELADLLEMVQTADLETAKLDVSLLEGEATLEAGGKFDDASEFADAAGEQFDGETMSHMYGAFDESAETTTIHLDGLVDGDATEEDVRESAVADDETTIFLPDEWDEDEQEFDELDVEQAADFLGIELEEETDPDTLTAEFTVDPAEPAVNETVTFDASDSTTSDGEIESYEWDLGDGSSAEGAVVEHTYEDAGEYEVTLTVTDADGNSDTATDVIVVEADEPDEDPSVADYADEEGIVHPPGVLEAIDDWRDDEIDTPLVLEVIDAWRDGEPVT